ncbi:MAG: hypothetical protein V4615_13100 [Bacteroidota bacterium]
MGEDIYDSNTRYFTIIGIISLIFSTTVLLDRYLPLSTSKEIVSGKIFYKVHGRYLTSSKYGFQTDKDRFPVNRFLLDDVTEGDTVEVVRTLIFNNPLRVCAFGYVYPNGTVYSFYQIPLYLLFIFSITLLYFRKKYIFETYVLAAFTFILLLLAAMVFIDDIYVAAS